MSIQPGGRATRWSTVDAGRELATQASVPVTTPASYNAGVRCAACGEMIPEGSRFCPSCGSRISGNDEERRVVTVLFADMVGFTALSEHRDPEQVKHLVDECFQWLTAEIVGFGGRVDKIIGDAILALFGAPIAHEDDPERAVRVALRMQDIIRERSDELEGAVRLRIGVNTGEVLTGALAAGGDYTAMGDVVNSANRLQIAAQPGEVLVGASTYAATARVIPYQDRGPVPAKGRGDALHAWSAQPPRTAPGERPGRTHGPLVGRGAEVEVLGRVASTALANERASLLVLLGDAGMGKSRVAAEVTTSLRCEQEALVLQGRCVPYGEVNAWWPLAEALRGPLQAEIGDPREVIEPRLRSLVADTMGEAGTDRDIERTTRGLARLFGFVDARTDLDPDRVREEVVRSFVTLLDHLSVQRPVVLWLSDMHWSDPAVFNLLETAMAALARRPLVIVATARRSVLQSWSPPVGRFDTFALNLEALSADAVDALIEALVAEHAHHTLGEVAKADLRERSGGNPLFLIELMTLLEEQRDDQGVGGDELAVMPDTLRGLVAARLDRLESTERALIDDAAVLGRRGKVAHLSEMAQKIRGTEEIQAPLAQVVERELLRVDGDDWEFTSDLTREVAYGMLTKSDRANKHLGVARWIESAYAASANDRVADLLAHHYGQAAELLDDLGTVGRLSPELIDRALHWIDEVSARDERMRLLPAVERLCTQGLALAGDGRDAVRLALLVRRAQTRAQARNATGATDDAAEAAALARQLGDESALGAIQLVEGEIAQHRGDLNAARATFADAAQRYEATGDIEGRAEALRSLGMAELFAGRTAEAERTSSEAREAFRSIGRRSGEAWALQNLAWISFVQGRTSEAEERIGEALELFGAAGDLGGSAWARGLQGFVRLSEGNLDEAESLQGEVLAEAQASGDRWASAMMLLLGSIIRLWTGRTEDAISMATEGLGLFRSVHDRFGQARIVLPLARGLAMRGKIDAARNIVGEVRRAVEQRSGTTGERPATGEATMEDRAVLAVTIASIEMHAGQPASALDALASLTEELGFGDVARGLRGSEHAALSPSWVPVALSAGAGIDLLTVIGSALLQSGRVSEAASVLDATALQLDEGMASAALSGARALVRAAEGRFGEADELATTVLTDERASYLDRTLAGLASGLAAARAGDAIASDRGFGAARVAVDATGDRLTRALVDIAEARAATTLGRVGSGDDAAWAAAQRGIEAMGTDAPGWVTVFDLALGPNGND